MQNNIAGLETAATLLPLDEQACRNLSCEAVDPKQLAWHLLAAKYPSPKSSSGSYALNLAQGLARVGQQVHIWHSQREPEASKPSHPLVSTHPVPSDWGAEALAYVDAGLDQTPGPRRLFLHFDPWAFGGQWNLRLPGWLARRKSKGDEIWLMIHQAFVPASRLGSPLAWGRCLLQRRLFARIAANCDQIFLSAPQREPVLKPLVRYLGKHTIWLPIPSNVSWVESGQRARNLRKAFAPYASLVLGTFGSYHDPAMVDFLSGLIPSVLAQHGERLWLCLGRGSQEFVSRLRRQHPSIAPQMGTAGELDITALSAHLQACDIMVQPYPFGVDTSRTSIMAGLSHGRPIVTTLGPYTEDIWVRSSCVRLSPSGTPEVMSRVLEQLIEDPQSCQRLAHKARQTYQRYFSLDCCLRTLLASSAQDSLLRN